MRKIIRPSIFLIITFFILLSNQSQAQYKLNDKGLLWEITGNGLKKPSYLYGTMHVSKKVAFHLSDTFFVAIKKCDIVALEMNPETWLKELLESDLYGSLSGMRGYYGGFESNGNLYFNRFSIGFPNKEDYQRALRKDNQFANSLLYRAEGYTGDFEESTFLDMFIYQSGKRNKKEITGLEQFDKTMEMSIKAQMPDDEETKKKRKKKRRNSLSYGFGYRELIEDAYRKGDLDLLDSLSKETSQSENFHKYMIVERNKIMANNMDSIMKLKSLFTGIGAAHLPGEDGVIKLLRDMGYSVRCVDRYTSNKSIKLKTKIEKTIVSQDFSTKYPDDSLFSVDLPGQLFETSAFNGKNEYFYPDMANGAYYHIIRISHFNKLINKSDDYVLKTIDSLLFENIPGKILKQKEIEHNGYKGIQIFNKTRKGDYQRYKIFVTPLEVYIFKVGGTGDFAKGKEALKFINSINIKPNSNKVAKYTAPDQSFTIDFPSQFIENNTSQKSMVYSTDLSGKGIYIYQKSDYYDFFNLESDTFELNVMSENFAEEMDFELQWSKSFNSNDGYPAIYFGGLDEDKNKSYALLTIRGPSYYMGYTKCNDSLAAYKFLNSLKFADPVYKNQFTEYVDSTMLLKVTTSVQGQLEDKYKKLLGKSFYNYRSKYDRKKQPFESIYEYKTYTNLETGEKVKVMFSKLHDYTQQDSIDQKPKSEYYDDDYKYEPPARRFISDSSLTKNDSVKIYNYTIRDSASTRMIKKRIIHTGNRSYFISAYLDSITGPSAFYDSFFGTISPLDTVMGLPLKLDKVKLFFDNAYSDDSTKRAQSLASFYKIKFKDENVPQLIKMYNDFEFDEENEIEDDLKTSILYKIASLEHPSVLPELKKIYKEAGDTSSIQFRILNLMLNQRNIESYNEFKAIMLKDPPLSNDDEKVYELFENLYDSLELAAKLYPDLMELAKYEEYRLPLYNLTASLSDSGKINEEMYSSNKGDIERFAVYALKRYRAQQISENTYDEDAYSSYERYSDYDYEYDDYDFSSRNRFGMYGHSKEIEYDNELIMYAKLLVPYYDETRVKNYFKDLQEITDQDISLSLNLLLRKNNKFVHDSVWGNYVQDSSFRYNYYLQLKNDESLDLFDSAYLNQKSMVEAMLYNNYSFDESDSISLYKIDTTMVADTAILTYFFMLNEIDEDDIKNDYWKLYVIGDQPLDSTKFEDYPRIMRKSYKLETEKDNDDFIKAETKKYRYFGHSRYKAPYTNRYSRYSDYYDY